VLQQRHFNDCGYYLLCSLIIAFDLPKIGMCLSNVVYFLCCLICSATHSCEPSAASFLSRRGTSRGIRGSTVYSVSERRSGRRTPHTSTASVLSALDNDADVLAISPQGVRFC
jgi:hypothetical protein